MKIKDTDIQQLIGNILRYGVYISLTLSIIGGIMFLMHHGQDMVGMQFASFHEQDHTVSQIIRETAHGVLQLDGLHIIMLGILVLLVTPTIRVVFSLLGFALERDWLYIVITLIVLVIISVSIEGGWG